MKMKSVNSPQVARPRPQTWTNCKVVGNQVFFSGMTAHDQKGGIAGAGSIYHQACHCFQKIKHLMEAAGGKMNDVVKVNIYVTDITKREEVWRARREFFTSDFPCSTLVEVSALAPPGILVEVEAVGFIGAGPGERRGGEGARG